MRLTEMARQLLEIRDDLNERTNGVVDNNIAEIIDFDQTWASTALGFGGCGGSAMTTERTYVIFPGDGDAYVYFGSIFAYESPVNDRFIEDMNNHNMASVREKSRYFK